MREFLVTRRAKLTPDQAGIPFYGQRRRVPGLRREEVAQLAGLSVDYYTRLEKGNLRGVSDSVLEAIARALQLDDAERAHLFDLARAARNGARRPAAPRRPAAVRPSVQHLLDSMTDLRGVRPRRAPGHPRDQRTRPRLLLAGLRRRDGDPRRPANLARYCFLDALRPPSSTRTGTRRADTTVAILRTEAGRDPHNRALTDLVGELATRSEDFRTRWAAHDVRLHHTGIKRFRHPVVGDLAVGFNAMEMPADPGLTLTMYTAEPGSASEEKLTLLASWGASVRQTHPDPAAGKA